MSDVTPISATNPATGPVAVPSRAVPAGNGWQWVAAGLSLFGQSALMWIVFVVLFVVIAIAAGLIPIVGQLLLNLAIPLIVAGTMLGCRAIERGETLEIDHFVTAATEKPLPLLLLGLLYMVASLLVLLVMAVSVALLLALTIGIAAVTNPGNLTSDMLVMAVLMGSIGVLIGLAIYVPVAMAFWFAVPLIQFQGMDPLEALQTSFNACLQNIMPFLIYGLAMLGLLIVAIIPLGLGLLVIIPLMYITTYTSYQDVFAARE